MGTVVDDVDGNEIWTVRVPYSIPQHDGAILAEDFRELDTAYSVALWREMNTDPVKYFSSANKGNWVRYTGIEAGVIFTEGWATRIAQQATDDSWGWLATRLYATQWPLPVGRESLAEFTRFIEQFMRRRLRCPLVSRGLLPFDGDELATMIVEVEIAGTSVEAFGLVHRVPGVRLFRPSAMKFRISGDPPSLPVREYCRGIDDWWRNLAGESLSSGRPSKPLSYETARTAYWTLRELLEETCEKRKPNYHDICDFLASQGNSVGKTVFGVRVGEWRRKGLTWPPPAPGDGA